MIKNIKKSENSNIVNITTINNNTNPTLIDPGSFLEQSYYFNSINPDDMKKFIKHVEDKTRKSPMYSNYIGHLRDKGMDHCFIKGNISQEDATIEFHHYPFTLFDIVNIILKKNIAENIKTTSFSLVLQIMEEHSKNNIGLIALSVTEHTLYHDGKKFIPLTQVYGNINRFIEEYSDYISEDLEERYNKLVDLTEKYEKEQNKE